MILYHIEKSKFQDVWPPEGTLHGKGRWNRIGQWIIYTSPSIALAKLEILANDNFLPIERVCMVIEVSDEAAVFEVDEDLLPPKWYEFPPNSQHTKLTDAFLNLDKLLMKVPSAQCHREHNYLINVKHSRFEEQVRLVETFKEIFDPRLK